MQEGGRPETLLYGRVGRSWVEYDSSVDSISCHLKLQRVDVDAKWSGAPWAGLLQPQGERAAGDRPLLEGALVVNRAADHPRHIRYASLLLQALQVKVDEDTLMKLVPYARTRVGPYTAPPSPPIYFEQFEIHPIKVRNKRTNHRAVDAQMFYESDKDHAKCELYQKTTDSNLRTQHTSMGSLLMLLLCADSGVLFSLHHRL